MNCPTKWYIQVNNCFVLLLQWVITHFVTFIRRRSRMHLITEIPSDVITFAETRMISSMPTVTTKQSKRLKIDMKYIRRPKAYIFMTISIAKQQSRILLTVSEGSKTWKAKLMNLKIIYSFSHLPSLKTSGFPGQTLKLSHPFRLWVMFWGNGESVE